ncbi:RNB-domain-containing protein [Conidiobolus coronatus NRRL 28638]|uniref:RNB-domain-containing protein n=1 Tax=Conidiobolus coronatus (strain ATCC 28846 / CBS 209.66 / NRRL 28638) TaxID=796925 RepID=A0A137NZF9_CONC2|nr:RNB-domain-containing protein [Conidiobolus coronatus NRRL 28638]|eukprot:KXN68223.1 RNB-domain-containing protein [Conidiobolus coronatus NRRL 28638]
MTILPPHEDVFKILEESQPTNIPKNKPLILTVQNKPKNKAPKNGKESKESKENKESKPKRDPIEEEINSLLLNYLMQKKKSKDKKYPAGGFKEYAEKYASSSQVVERLSFKDVGPEKEKIENDKSAKNSNSENKKDKKSNHSLGSDNTNASSIKDESQDKYVDGNPDFKLISAKKNEAQKEGNRKNQIFDILFCQNEVQKEESSTDPVVANDSSENDQTQDNNTSSGPVVTKILTRPKNIQEEDSSANQVTKILTKQKEAKKEESSLSPAVAKILSKKGKSKKKETPSKVVVTKILTRPKDNKQEGTSSKQASEDLSGHTESQSDSSSITSATENLPKQNEGQEEKSSADSDTAVIKSKKKQYQDKATPAGPVVTKILTRKKEAKQNDVNYNQLAEIFSKKEKAQDSDVRKDPSFKLILTEIHDAQKEDTDTSTDNEITSKQDESQEKAAFSDIEAANKSSGKRSQVINFRQLEGHGTKNSNKVNKADLPVSQNDTTEKSSKKKKKKKKKSKKEKEKDEKAEKEVDISLFKSENEEKSKSKKSKETPKKEETSKSKSKRRCQDYISEYKIPYLLKSGELLSGEFRLNSNARWEGFITPQGDPTDQDILIPGFYNQNRALYGDLVAVELYSINDGHKEIKAVFNERYAKHYIERGLRVGKVVRILNRDPSLTFVGTILPSGYDKSKTNGEKHACDTEAYNDCNSYVFIPNNIRIPFLIVPKQSVSSIIAENWGTFKNQVFEAKITNWSPTEKHPLGKIVKCLGPMGDLRSTQNNILIDNTIIDKPFSKTVLDDLPKTPYTIKAIHLKTRVDFRNECVFTIDPSTARDLDDAVSIKQLPNGNFEVGVHIADVSHFITPGSALDKEALKRGTSTYLVNRVIPMLPELLCQDLCSLNPGVDRLTFSVVWELDPEGNRITTSYAKGVIKSCGKLAYEDAQEVIEGRHLPSDVTIYGDHDVSKIEQNIMHLFNLSQKMRKRRFDSGAVQVNRFRLSINLDQDGFPESFYTYQGKESNKLIEEFMLLANMSVAEKIYEEYPAEAMMRCHPLPIQGRLEVFSQFTEKIHKPFVGESSSALTEYFNSIKDPIERFCLENMAVKTFLMRAKYLCNSNVSEPAILHHFALNVDYYTHFTSPIRRYPDLVVHRQLMAIIQGDKKFSHGKNREPISDIAHQCNSTKFKARTAQDQSTQLYLAHYIHKQIKLTKKPIRTTGYIFNLDRHYMEVVIPEYALEETIKWETNFNFVVISFSSTHVTLSFETGTEVIKNKPDLAEAEVFPQSSTIEISKASDDAIVHEDIENIEDSEINKDAISCEKVDVQKDNEANNDDTEYDIIDVDGDAIAYEKLEADDNEAYKEIPVNENDKIQENTESAKSLEVPRLVNVNFDLFKPVPLLISVTMNHVTPRIHIYVDELPIYDPRASDNYLS